VDAGESFEIPKDEEYELEGSYDKNGDSDLGFEVEWSVVKGDPNEVLFSDPTEINSKVTFLYPGDYQLRLIITDPYDEDDEIFYQLIDYVDVVVTFTTSVNILTKQNLNIQPNPARDYIIVEYNGEEYAKYDLIVFDNSGKKLFQSVTSGAVVKERIDASIFPSGNYFLELRIGDNKVTERFTVVK